MICFPLVLLLLLFVFTGVRTHTHTHIDIGAYTIFNTSIHTPNVCTETRQRFEESAGHTRPCTSEETCRGGYYATTNGLTSGSTKHPGNRPGCRYVLNFLERLWPKRVKTGSYNGKKVFLGFGDSSNTVVAMLSLFLCPLTFTRTVRVDFRQRSRILCSSSSSSLVASRMQLAHTHGEYFLSAKYYVFVFSESCPHNLIFRCCHVRKRFDFKTAYSINNTCNTRKSTVHRTPSDE